MKLLLSSRVPGDVQRASEILNEEGIPCMVRGEFLSGVAGEVPPMDCVPELWLMDEQHLDAAQRVLRDLRALPAVDASAAAGPWRCPGCQELHSPEFDSCWRCGADRAGRD